MKDAINIIDQMPKRIINEIHASQALTKAKKIDFSMHYRQERIQVSTDAIYCIKPLRKFLYTVTFLTHKYRTICCLSIMN